MPFCTKDYHPAAAHPCLHPRLIPGTKRKREDDSLTLAPFWHWYLIRNFSGDPPSPKVRLKEENGSTNPQPNQPIKFSSLLLRHAASIPAKPTPQRKGVRFLMASEPSSATTTKAAGAEQEPAVAVTIATYFRTKAPSTAWIKGDGPSQVDNEGTGMTTYGEGGQLSERGCLFCASGDGEIVEVVKGKGLE